MSLKDRLKGKKKTTAKQEPEKAEKLSTRRVASKAKKEEISLNSQEYCEIKLSIAKITKAVNNAQSVSEIGAIAQEFSRFLSSLSSANPTVTFSGSFDLGQRTLLNCFLEKFKYDEENPRSLKAKMQEEYEEEVQKATKKKSPSKQMTKRKSIKQRLEEELKMAENAVEEDESEE